MARRSGETCKYPIRPVRRTLADEHDAELDSNLSGLEISQLINKYLESIASHPRKTLVTRRHD
jgi:hypothetical protein